MSGLRNVEARRFMIIRHFFPTEREIVFGTHFVIPCPSVTQVEYYSPSDGNQGGSVVRVSELSELSELNTTGKGTHLHLSYTVGNTRKRNTSNHSPFPTEREIVLCSVTKGVKRRVSTMYFYISSIWTMYIHW